MPSPWKQLFTVTSQSIRSFICCMSHPLFIVFPSRVGTERQDKCWLRLWRALLGQCKKKSQCWVSELWDLAPTLLLTHCMALPPLDPSPLILNEAIRPNGSKRSSNSEIGYYMILERRQVCAISGLTAWPSSNWDSVPSWAIAIRRGEWASSGMFSCWI